MKEEVCEYGEQNINYYLGIFTIQYLLCEIVSVLNRVPLLLASDVQRNDDKEGDND